MDGISYRLVWSILWVVWVVLNVTCTFSGVVLRVMMVTSSNTLGFFAADGFAMADAFVPLTGTLAVFFLVVVGFFG